MFRTTTETVLSSETADIKFYNKLMQCLVRIDVKNYLNDRNYVKLQSAVVNFIIYVYNRKAAQIKSKSPF